ncbi:glycosyltransferase family 4 protein [Pseudoalteromonas sp. Z9A5]|uniref:glycosyltransferase family 4 protein n=1 Tax=Pseudoalteromonas sp. Z9A5 TaxID=2686355 RepID=UPI00140CD5BB|nr:glycosyltransferase family 4 protein [Pseudoalteromonas sp. Z9A5]
MNKYKNLTIATSIDGKGGVATVLNVLKSEGFFSQSNSELLVSHSRYYKYKLFNSLFVFTLCINKLIYNLLFNKVGAIHFHMSSRGSYMRKSILVRIAKCFKVKIIIHLHSGEFRKFYSEECNSKKREHIRNTFNMADKVIVLSAQVLDWLNTILDDKSKGVVIYNSVPCKLIKPLMDSEFFNFVFLGRLADKKGVSDLIMAFSIVAKSYPQARLLLGGDGELDKFKILVSKLNLNDSVQFLGWISGDAKDELLRKTNSYVLPSYNEGFPMGILEAMSCNIPIIATDVGGIPDAITSGEEGLLINAGDIDGLTNAMKYSIESPLEIQRMQEKASIKYLNKFSPNIIIPQLITIYKDLGVA